MIYMFKAKGADICKIGTAGNVEARFKNCATHCPFPLEVFETREGGRTIEHLIHKRCASFRVHREWFDFTPEVISIFRSTSEKDLEIVEPKTAFIDEGDFNFVERLRISLGETQAVFAKRFKVSQVTVHFWEKSGPPTRGMVREALIDLAAKNGVALDEPEQAAQ